MSKLSEDIRASYDRQQARLGDVGDARQRLIQNVLTAPSRESHRLQWAAAIAAVLIGAIVITTFVLVRGNVRPQVVPGASPKASASPTPLRNTMNVPDSTPLILYHDPVNFDQVNGITWDGKTSGRVISGATNGGFANPQGSLIATGPDLRNRGGHVVGTYDPKNQDVFLADDGAHFCSLDRVSSRNTTSEGVLSYGLPGQPGRRVAAVGTLYPASSNGGGPSVIACSPSADRAVVYQSGGQGVGVVHFWVIQLSTGKFLWTGGGGWGIAASHDGQYIALLTDGSGSTSVYGPTGEDLAHLGNEVFAFSWDDRLAVVAAPFTALPSVMDWRRGQTIWTCPNSTFKYWQAFAEPGGSRVAIGALDPKYPQTGGFAPIDLFVVGADGINAFEREDITLFSQ